MAAECSTPLSVFFPVDCLSCENGILFGWKSNAPNEFLVVATVIRLNEIGATGMNPQEWLNNLKEKPNIRYADSASAKLAFLGLWCVDDDYDTRKELAAVAGGLFESKNEEYILLRKKENSSTPALYCRGHLKELNALVITYSKPRGSCVLSITPLSLNFASGSYDLKTAEANTRLDTVPVPARENSHLQEIIPLVNASKEIENSIHVNWSLQVSRVDRQSSVQDFVVNPIRSLLCLILVLFSYAAEVFTTLGRSKFFLFRAVTFLFSLPVMFLQFSQRMQQARIIHKYINDKVDINSFLKKVNTTENRSPQSIGNPQKVLNTMESSNALKCTRQALSISHRNLVFSILFDVILGIFMVFCLYFYNAATSMADGIIKTTELVADLVSRLIIWMMGVPAGLKLNKELANLLGQFFLYHIFLWKTYLAFLQPYIQSIVWFSILPGCCGFTFLLSLVSDVLSLLTLHIYCFYVYAARIYNLQVHYLLLLGRHFTGKRWNVQTNQLEPVPYKVDQLFIRTVVFTILLFLVPTTALFYFVFTSLRLLVLILKWLLSYTIGLLNRLPVFAVCVALFRPDYLAGGLLFELVNAPESEQDALSLDSFRLQCCSGVVHLKMRNQPLPLSTCFNWSVPDSAQDSDEDQRSWTVLIKKLLLGQFIYPWIKKNQ